MSYDWVAGETAYTLRNWIGPPVVSECRLVRLNWPGWREWIVMFDGDLDGHEHSRMTWQLFAEKEDACRHAAVVALSADAPSR